jgi:putative tryptophan/tyrosine transport system substrate-binding protein
MMRRRTFIASTVSVLAAPLAVEAQLVANPHRIGLLSFAAPPATPYVDPSWYFRQGLLAIGHQEGRTFLMEYRWAGRDPGQLPILARELVQLPVDVIVTLGTPAAQAAASVTKTIPIIMAGVDDPVRHGLVASLGRPGGNVTGLAHVPGSEFYAKQIEVFKEAVPRLSRVAVVGEFTATEESIFGEMQASAQPFSVKLLRMRANDETEFAAVFASLKRERADGLFVYPGSLNYTNRRWIADFAATNGLPTMFVDDAFVRAGGLMSYFTHWGELRRRAAVYVDKVLKGAKPADLPIEQPTKFELVINLKTAKALGLTIPPSVLARADELIQ